jgi:hypothetical protein
MARPNAEDPLVPFPVRLPTSLAEQLRAEAIAAGCTNSDVFRRYLALADAKPLNKSRPVKRQKYTGRINHADPELMRVIAGIGNNLNQIAHGLNSANLKNEPLAKIHILTVLRSIEQKLEAIGAKNAA